ncbi:MAG: type II secretion system secretin GspD [Kiritimatiellae bacterium]|nr:type II secretion system secretin GspD [Kiritimatiellia bacterium]
MKNKLNFISLKLALVTVAFLVASSIAEAQQPQNNAPAPNRQTPNAIRRGRPADNNNNANNANAKPAASQGKGVNQNPTGAAPAIPFDQSPNGLNFQDAAADLLIMDYAMRTGRLVVKDPATPAPLITLRSTPESPLSDEEYLLAIESVLNLNGIALEKDGDKFLKVFPSTEFHRRGIKGDIVSDVTSKDAILPEDGSFVTRTIRLNYITIEEAKAIVEGFVRTGSQIQTFERDNSFRITDSVENVNRIIEMLSHLDKPIPALEETAIIKIQYAKATEIKERLMEIVTDAQEEQEKNKNAATERTTGAPGTYNRPLPPGVPGNRWNRNQQNNQQNNNKPAGNAAIDAAVADAQRGLIRGKVSIFADERTNILIVITRKENLVFFEKLIKELDVPTAPDVLAEVIRLEYAIAEDVAELLNELIDNAQKDSNDAKVRRDNSSDNANNNNKNTATQKKVASGTGTQMIGQLDSENIKVLSDERTNSLLVMAPAADMQVIKNIIKNVDIMLSQVVIDAAIVSVKFTDSMETGMDWVQRTMLTDNGKIAFATSGGGGSGKATPALSYVTDATGIAGAGANLVTTIFDFNMDLILKAVETDSRSRLLSSPRITTLDNKEAVLEATERIYWNEGTTYYDDSNRSSDNVKNEDIGIKLTVTPRINKNGFINLTIEQEMQTNEGYKPIATGNNTSEYPMLNTRKMGADVAVQSGETVVLGGLAQNQITVTQSKVPILGSIPLLGWLFRSEKEENTHTEIIVFITPRIIDTPSQIEDDARKVRATIDSEGVWDSGWSYSRLADQKSEKDRKSYIENSRKTVEKPNSPVSGYLTNTNEENGFDNPAKGRLNPDGSATKYPYIHFTEAENLRSLPNGVVLPSEESTEETKTTEEQILQVPQTDSDDEIVDSKIQESSEN